MDLKNTKGMQLSTTESRFKPWVLAHGIGKVSAELKSTSGKSQSSGYLAELNVIKLLQSNNWILCFQGFKTPIAEIDLIFEKENEILLIEVKTLNNSWRAFQRIENKQLSKLQKNFILFSRRYKTLNFRALVAWVDPQNKITFVEIS